MADISLLKMGKITSNINETLKFLRNNNLLKDAKFCLTCERFMSHIKDTSRSDKYVWRCPSCRKTAQIREDSFWMGQRHDLSVYLYILYLFAHNVNSETASKLLVGEIHIQSIYTWYNLYRDVMSKSLLQAPIQVGGPGTVVEIDESKWGHKRKYNRGRMADHSQWVFGLIERGTGKVCLITVNRRTAAELLPVVQQVVLPGTTIMSDQWAAYNSLSDMGYHHHTVNHSENFIDPVTGAHTQTIESFWGNSKAVFKMMRGCSPEQLPGYLDEIMFRWNNKHLNMFRLLMEKIAEFYPINDTIDFRRFGYLDKPPIEYHEIWKGKITN